MQEQVLLTGTVADVGPILEWVYPEVLQPVEYRGAAHEGLHPVGRTCAGAGNCVRRKEQQKGSISG